MNLQKSAGRPPVRDQRESVKVVNIHDFPVDLRLRAKSAAAQQNITLREFFIQAVQDRLDSCHNSSVNSSS